jgi:DNA-binding transcriptional ArsR family regulator
MHTTETEIALDMQAMRAAATEACRMMKALSNPDRLLLLCQMAQGEICVSELETRVGIGQPTLSQQLGVLRAQELVNTRRDGKNIYYQISNPQALAIMGVLYEQFCTSHTE